MNKFDAQIDNSRRQYELFGNAERLKNEPYENPVQLPQNERTLLRSLISDLSKTGNTEEAFKLLCDTIEEMEQRLKELEKK